MPMWHIWTFDFDVFLLDDVFTFHPDKSPLGEIIVIFNSVCALIIGEIFEILLFL